MMPAIYYRLCAMQIFDRSFGQLCCCLRGAPPKIIDWLSLIGLANDTLTTPALISFVSRFHDEIPPEVSRYIRELCIRNEYRNQRLSNQLGEALMALNDRGVTPVLFKGSARLATFESAVNAGRIISDLDIRSSVLWNACLPLDTASFFNLREAQRNGTLIWRDMVTSA
jgi:hypothetical protein